MAKHVLQLEDDIDFQRSFQDDFAPYTSNGSTLIQCFDLDRFRLVLTEHQDIRHFLLDGRFPRKIGGPIDFHLPLALEALHRNFAGRIHRIVVYSSEVMDELEQTIHASLIPKEKVRIVQKTIRNTSAFALEELMRD